ncbi:MAG TPA: T9SS type A sorting domain-containing protein [Crocinitomix sp.]|nr:T9SS type A sorting domain-containing protein [Crocinitomix sp.]
MKILILSIFIFSAQASFGFAGWTQKANFPNLARHRAASFAIGNKGYVGIGHTNGAGPNIVFNDWWEFDPATNSWTQKADFPIGNYGVSTFVIGNKGYMGGGNIGNGDFYEYKPSTNKWAPIPNPPTTPDDETAFTINGKGYVLDDMNLYEFDPSTNNWTTKGTIPENGWQTSSFVIDGKGYLKANNNLYEYKPLTDTWITRAPFPGLASSGSGAFAINNQGYIICGYDGFLSAVVSEVWVYDPPSDTWTQKPDFPGTARRFCTSFSIGNKGYFGLGTNGTNFGNLWEYNPEIEFLSVTSTNLISITPYPNPSTNIITFDFSQSNLSLNALITVYNLQGKVVRSELITNPIYKLNKKDFEDGTYFYQISVNTDILHQGSFIFE